MSSRKRRERDYSDEELQTKRRRLQEDAEDDTQHAAASSTSAADEERAKPSAAPARSRTGGVYMPPFKLAMMQQALKDKSSREYQRMTWDNLKKSINGLINKINKANVTNIIPELFGENLVRGRGLLCRSLMKAQAASPTFTQVYAALVAVVNTKMPQVGELLLMRLVVQFRKAFRRNNKTILLASTRFIAHLVNQQVAGEIVALQIIALLLEQPTDDSVEVCVGFVRECGFVLQDLSPEAFHEVFDRFRAILHEGSIDKRVQYMIEGLFADRKSNFRETPGVLPELDLVDADDQITHEDVTLDEEYDVEEELNIFQYNENYEQDEQAYEGIKKEILGEESSSEEEDEEDEVGGDESDIEDDDEEGEAQAGVRGLEVSDQTEGDVISLRRNIYLTIMSSLDFEDCAHLIMKKGLDSNEREVCVMIIECCSQERTYMRFYGLLAQRFCMLNREIQQCFVECFCEQYSTIHRLETNKLRNVAKLFAHLFHSDALSWEALQFIRLNEQDTTSSSRIFIKILMQEMAEFLGLAKLNERFRDPYMQPYFAGLFPRDNPKNTRFAINFFTSIGLGGLTDGLREHLRNAPKLALQQADSSSDSSSDSDSSDSSDSSSSSDSDLSSSDSDTSSSDSSASPARRRRRRASLSPRRAQRHSRERARENGERHREDRRGSTDGRGDRGRDRDEDRDGDGRRGKESERSEKRDRDERDGDGSRISRDRDRGRERRGGDDDRHRRDDRDRYRRSRRDDRDGDRSGDREYERRDRRDSRGGRGGRGGRGDRDDRSAYRRRDDRDEDGGRRRRGSTGDEGRE